MACFFDRPRLRPGVGYRLAVFGFRDFVTGHRCLGEESPREEGTVSRGASAGGEALSGNHLPNPIPPRVRRHTSTAQTPAKACATLHGACPRLSGMAMPDVSYTGLGGVEHRRPSCFSRRPQAPRRTALRHPHPVPVGHAAAGPSPREVTPLRRRSDLRTERARRWRPERHADRRATRSGGLRRTPVRPRGSRVSQHIGRWSGPVRPRPRPHRDGPPRPPPGSPNPPRFTGIGERTGAASTGRLCARRDRIQHTQPMVFSQLRPGAETFAVWPDTPPPTRQERTARYAFTRRGRATLSKGTSLCASQVERFVIERFTPRFLIDIELVGEGVTAGPRDAVDSILEIGDWGHVRHRGETCRSDRPVRTRETRTPRGA